MALTKSQERDYKKYFKYEGDPGFSPERNKATVERTIQKTMSLRKKKHLQYVEGLRERADAVDTYLRSRIAQGNTPIEKYFGKKWMAYLRGQKILNIIKTKKGKVYLPGD